MRCLRSIGAAQQTGHVYLSDENISILEEELQQNFRITVGNLEASGQDREIVQVHVKTPVERITLTRVRRRFFLREKDVPAHVTLRLQEAPTEQYRLIHEEREGLTATSRHIKTEDMSSARQRRQFSGLTLVAEVARYLNKSCLVVEELLANSTEGIGYVLARVNEFNELLYGWVIPHLFQELFEIEEFERREEYIVDLVKLPEQGFYELSAKSILIVRKQDAGSYASKSFHLDAYCFDSEPERRLLWDLLRDGQVKKVYFTGMLTHGQSEFYVQYIDPESHTIRSYYPDFLLQKDDGHYVIVEVKGDHQIEAPVVLAKKAFAEQMAKASNMTYSITHGMRNELLKSSPLIGKAKGVDEAEVTGA